MVHSEVFKHFADIFPNLAEQYDVYFPCGKNCIRVRMAKQREYVFTYYGANEWKFETLSSYMKTMKGGKR